MAKLPSQGIRFSDAAIRREGLMKKKKKDQSKVDHCCNLYLHFISFLF